MSPQGFGDRMKQTGRKGVVGTSPPVSPGGAYRQSWRGLSRVPLPFRRKRGSENKRFEISSVVLSRTCLWLVGVGVFWFSHL